MKLRLWKKQNLGTSFFTQLPSPVTFNIRVNSEEDTVRGHMINCCQQFPVHCEGLVIYAIDLAKIEAGPGFWKGKNHDRYGSESVCQKVIHGWLMEQN